MKILGYDYKFDFSAGMDSIDAAGRCHLRTQIIQIANDLTPSQIQSTVIHEIMEAAKYHLGLELSHNAIMSLETVLYQTLTDAGVDLSLLTKEFI